MIHGLVDDMLASIWNASMDTVSHLCYFAMQMEAIATG